MFDKSGLGELDGDAACAAVVEAQRGVLKQEARVLYLAAHWADLHHVVPYLARERGGARGQTRLGNLAPLSRFPHRLVTHGRWRMRQTAPGTYLWRSPHGYWWRVDPTGTHALGKHRRPR